jgi:hypothetical protein
LIYKLMKKLLEREERQRLQRQARRASRASHSPSGVATPVQAATLSSATAAATTITAKQAATSTSTSTNSSLIAGSGMGVLNIPQMSTVSNAAVRPSPAAGGSKPDGPVAPDLHLQQQQVDEQQAHAVQTAVQQLLSNTSIAHQAPANTDSIHGPGQQEPPAPVAPGTKDQQTADDTPEPGQVDEQNLAETVSQLSMVEPQVLAKWADIEKQAAQGENDLAAQEVVAAADKLADAAARVAADSTSDPADSAAAGSHTGTAVASPDDGTVSNVGLDPVTVDDKNTARDAAAGKEEPTKAGTDSTATGTATEADVTSADVTSVQDTTPAPVQPTISITATPEEPAVVTPSGKGEPAPDGEEQQTTDDAVDGADATGADGSADAPEELTGGSGVQQPLKPGKKPAKQSDTWKPAKKPKKPKQQSDDWDGRALGSKRVDKREEELPDADKDDWAYTHQRARIKDTKPPANSSQGKKGLNRFPKLRRMLGLA